MSSRADGGRNSNLIVALAPQHFADGRRPSPFVLLASDNLKGALRPALEHLFRWWTSRHPESGQEGSLLQRRADELIACLELVLHWHYLKRFRATFNEHFFGLERRPASSSWSILPPLWAVLPLQAVLEVIPSYLRAKLRKSSQGSGPTSKGSSRAFKALRQLCPVVQSGLDLLSLTLTVLHAANRSHHHNLPVLLAGQRLEPRTVRVHDTPTVPGPEGTRSAGWWATVALDKVLQHGVGAAAIGLDLGAHLLILADSWMNRESEDTGDPAGGSTVTSPDLQIPDYPPIAAMDEEEQHGRKSSRVPGQCPICKGPRQNEAALTTSGYVFCYRCIVDFLRQHRKCPVTHQPASEDCLIRIYSTVSC